jgi:hypothetical protein
VPLQLPERQRPRRRQRRRRVVFEKALAAVGAALGPKGFGGKREARGAVAVSAFAELPVLRRDAVAEHAEDEEPRAAARQR